MNDPKESQRLEFRYIGGADYEKNIGNLIYFMDRFIINTYDCIDADFSKEDIDKLEVYLDDNISFFKNFSKYDNFIVDYPSVQLQIDQQGDYDIVSTYYQNIQIDLYNIINSIYNLKECIINYVTLTQTMELVDAKIKSTSTISGLDLINCSCEGIFEDCFFVGSEITNSQVSKCKLQQSSTLNSKILNCNVESSDLTNCYFVDGYLNSNMFGGVYRSGKLGPYATLDSDVKVVTDVDNFFDTKFDTDSKGDSKGIIKGYKK